MTTIAETILTTKFTNGLEGLKAEAAIQCNMEVESIFDTIYMFVDNSSIIYFNEGIVMEFTKLVNRSN